MKQSSVRPSVRPSVCPVDSGVQRFATERLSSKCGQCLVDTRRLLPASTAGSR